MILNRNAFIIVFIGCCASGREDIMQPVLISRNPEIDTIQGKHVLRHFSLVSQFPVAQNRNETNAEMDGIVRVHLLSEDDRPNDRPKMIPSSPHSVASS
jgi:hypothetical protein